MLKEKLNGRLESEKLERKVSGSNRSDVRISVYVTIWTWELLVLSRSS